MDPTTFAVLQGAAGGAAGDPVYAEDVFSTFLYTGNAADQTITNGIDLSSEGGLVWMKEREGSGFDNHVLVDTERGRLKALKSDDASSETSSSNTYPYIRSFDTTGFTAGYNNSNNYNAAKYVSWTFRKCRGFFDVVTYTGNGNQNRAVPHSLGSTPGMIITKRTDDSQSWSVWHRNVQATWTGGTTEGNTTGGNTTGKILLDTGAAYDSGAGHYTYVNSSAFGVYYTNAELNVNGATYVSYIFAHDHQSFGTNRNESIIKCGEITAVSNTDVTVDLGWEPSWVLWKRNDGSGSWYIEDMMRGLSHTTGDTTYLQAENSDAEATVSNVVGTKPTPTGFIAGRSWGGDTGNDYIYIAIRRPHKPPTAGTEVYAAQDGRTASDGNTNTYTSGFPVDLIMRHTKAADSTRTVVFDRLGGENYLLTHSTAAETSGSFIQFDSMTGVRRSAVNANTGVFAHMFRRAPEFMDIVNYDATGSAQTVPHNLEVTPEMIIVKGRGSTYDWGVYHTGLPDPVDEAIRLNLDNAKFSSTIFNKQAPTSTNFYVNYTSGDYVAFLFATLPGISKVGSYTGTSNAINVDCGFTNGARFVLIKRADSSTGGHWYVFDTTQGINSGNDSYIRLNLANAQGSADLIDPYNAGFSVASGTTNVNYSGGTYIFLAIA